MHEHKQNQCKRKVKNRKNVVGLIIFCITVGIVFLYAYYQNLRKEIDVRQKWLETVLIGEKRWIIENQGSEGEIYMNGSEAGDVNPYFACMAALGLLAETKNCPITETEKKAVGRYLDWHTAVAAHMSMNLLSVLATKYGLYNWMMKDNIRGWRSGRGGVPSHPCSERIS